MKVNKLKLQAILSAIAQSGATRAYIDAVDDRLRVEAGADGQFGVWSNIESEEKSDKGRWRRNLEVRSLLRAMKSNKSRTVELLASPPKLLSVIFNDGALVYDFEGYSDRMELRKEIDGECFSVSADTMKSIINQAMMFSDPNGANLSHRLVEFSNEKDGHLRIVAAGRTNLLITHRFVCPLPKGLKFGINSCTLLGLKHLLNTCEDVRICVKDGSVYFRAGDAWISAPLLAKTYSESEFTNAKNFGDAVTVSRAELIQAVKDVAAVSKYCMLMCTTEPRGIRVVREREGAGLPSVRSFVGLIDGSKRVDHKDFRADCKLLIKALNGSSKHFVDLRFRTDKGDQILIGNESELILCMGRRP